MDEYQLRRDALFDAEVSAVQNGNTEEFHRIHTELDALDDKFRSVQEIKEPSYFGKLTRKVGNYILGGLAVTGLALTGAAKDMAGSSLEDSVDSYFADANNAHMIGDSDANQTTTNGNYVASLEDGRFINIVAIETGSETQIGGGHYAVGSMTMDGDVLQYTTLTLQGNEGMYRLNELDLNTGQTNILKEELSVSTPDFFTQHDTDGANNVYINDGAVVLNGETVYTIGNNSLPNVNGDSVAFVSEQTENNETTQSVVTIENGEINTIYSGNQSVEFVEFMDGQVVYGLENLIDNKTVDLYVGNSVREVPSGMFDADNGNLTWIEQTENGFAINLYNFETNQTENIYVSSAEMRNPQMSGDIVTWEQKYGISDSFKAWYSDVDGLMTFETEVPVDNGTVDNGTVDNGTVDNGTVDNGTPTVPGTPTEGTDYSLAITLTLGAGVLGIMYFMSRRKGDDSDDNGGLEDIFSDDEIKTIAGEVVDARDAEEYVGSEILEAPVIPEDLEPYVSDEDGTDGTDVRTEDNKEDQLDEVIGEYSPFTEEDAVGTEILEASVISEDFELYVSDDDGTDGTDVRTEDNKGDQLEKVLANMREREYITDEQYDECENRISALVSHDDVLYDDVDEKVDDEINTSYELDNILNEKPSENLKEISTDISEVTTYTKTEIWKMSKASLVDEAKTREIETEGRNKSDIRTDLFTSLDEEE